MKEIFVSPTSKRVFQCDCGNVVLVDNQTECPECGAWYEVIVERIDM